MIKLNSVNQSHPAQGGIDWQIVSFNLIVQKKKKEVWFNPMFYVGDVKNHDLMNKVDIRHFESDTITSGPYCTNIRV